MTQRQIRTRDVRADAKGMLRTVSLRYHDVRTVEALSCQELIDDRLLWGARKPFRFGGLGRSSSAVAAYRLLSLWFPWSNTSRF